MNVGSTVELSTLVTMALCYFPFVKGHVIFKVCNKVTFDKLK